MSATLLLLSLAFAFLAAGLSVMAVLLKRELFAVFSEALDGAARSIR
jgi:hypothetical protein